MIKYIFLTFVVVSLPWTFYDLYYEAEILRIHSLKESKRCLHENREEYFSSTSNDIIDPSTKNVGLVRKALTNVKKSLRYIRSYLTHDKTTCADHHVKAYTPSWSKVPPLRALSVTVARLFVYPLQYLGEGFGTFFNGIFTNSSVLSWPLVTVFLTFIVLIFTFFISGYKIHIPFLCKIEPSKNPSIYIDELYNKIGQLEDDITDVRTFITETNNRLLHIRDMLDNENEK